MRHNFSGERSTRFIAAEPASCPKLTRGVLQYDFGDEAGYTPLIPMYTLGHNFSPANIHAEDFAIMERCGCEPAA